MESRHIYMNDRAIRYTNTPSGFSFEGRKDNEFPVAWAEMSDELQEHDRLTEKRKKTTTVIETHYWNGGQSLRPYISSKTPIYNKNGKCLGTMWSAMKVTLFSPVQLVNNKAPSVLVTDVEHDKFTKRELDIIFWAQQRLSSKEIAKLLNISPRTVENKLSLIYEKVGVHSIIQLVEYCKEEGLDKYIPQCLLKKGIVFLDFWE